MNTHLKKLILITLVMEISCSIKETSVSESMIYGLYKRDYYDTVEYLCLKKNNSYTYFIIENNQTKTLTTNKWNFELQNDDSRIFLKEFDYSMVLKKYKKNAGGISTVILYSHPKKSVIIRMSEDHFKDFIRIDSISCELKIP
jgi:hypothetical protein